jgi:hypothetical protein
MKSLYGSLILVLLFVAFVALAPGALLVGLVTGVRWGRW